MRLKRDKKIKEIEDMFEEWNGSQGQGFSIEESKKNLMELEKTWKKDSQLHRSWLEIKKQGSMVVGKR